MEPFLSAHNHEDFEVTCYANVMQRDGVTERLKKYADRWRDIVGLPDEEVADLIRRDSIDILVELAGHTAHNRLLLFARKPAPIQVSYLGYTNTTGLSTIDYCLTDIHVDPPGMTESFYTEKMVRVPDTVLCYRVPENSPEISDLPSLKSGHITFSSFNNLTKITPGVIVLWSRTLLAVPGSRLLMKAKFFKDQHVEQEIRQTFEQHGISADRLELLSWTTGFKEHLEIYHRVDIGLDPFPFNGGTTSFESLWMGIPVVTLAGNSFVSRMGVRQACNVNLSHLIAQTPDEYVAIATRLAGDLDQLKQIRAGLRTGVLHSPLMDGPRLARALGKAYRDMWQSWCSSY